MYFRDSEKDNQKTIQQVIANKGAFKMFANLNDKQIAQKVSTFLFACVGYIEADGDPKLSSPNDVKPAYNAEEMKIIEMRFGKNTGAYKILAQFAVQKLADEPEDIDEPEEVVDKQTIEEKEFGC